MLHRFVVALLLLIVLHMAIVHVTIVLELWVSVVVLIL